MTQKSRNNEDYSDFFRAVILWINLLYHIALIAVADFYICTNHISK